MSAAREAAIATIGDLIAFPTVSRDSNRDLLDYVCDLLARHGVASEIVWNEARTKGNLWATIGPADKPGVILSGHSDVVPVDGQAWTSDPFRMREADGRLYGRGTCDMKGFIGIVLALVPELVARDLRYPVHIAISYDEELGCTGVWSLVEKVAALPVRPALCIVGEPTGMTAVTGHKGGACHIVTVHGSAAHSSLAPQAVNAVEHAAEIVRHIAGLSAELAETGPHDHHYDVPHSTLSVTTIGGGTAFNIIPERCELAFDLRALPGLDTEALIGRIAAFCDEVVLPRMRERFPEAAIDIGKVVQYPALDLDAGHPSVAFVNRLLGRNDYAKVAYGTEAGVFSARGGITSIVCGPGSIAQAHKADEFLDVTQVEACHAFLGRLADALEAGEVAW